MRKERTAPGAEEMKFRKKPVVVDAVEWDGKFENGIYEFYFLLAIQEWERECPQCHNPLRQHGRINTLEGSHIVCPGDWIITGIKGERYPCKPDVFAQTYEVVE